MPLFQQRKVQMISLTQDSEGECAGNQARVQVQDARNVQSLQRLSDTPQELVSSLHSPVNRTSHPDPERHRSEYTAILSCSSFSPNRLKPLTETGQLPRGRAITTQNLRK